MTLHSPAMPSAPAIVVDTLNSLLEAELNSVFRFVGPGSPYLSRATARLRAELHGMAETHESNASELAEAVLELGGTPVPRGLQPEEQYLAYLSLRFLLPKLVDAKELIVQRYEGAIAGVNKTAGTPPEILKRLERMREVHSTQLATLKKLSGEVLAAK